MASSDATTEQLVVHHENVPDRNKDSKSNATTPSENDMMEVRVQIYRSSGPWIITALSTPVIGEPRSSVPTLPSDIDGFLWGGLSVSIQEAMAPLLWMQLQRYLLIIFFSEFVVLLPLRWITTDAGYAFFLVYAPIILCIAIVLARKASIQIVLDLHYRIEDVVKQLSPHFHALGYDLQYGTQKTWRFGLDAFLIIKQQTASMSQEWIGNATEDSSGALAFPLLPNSDGATGLLGDSQQRRIWGNSLFRNTSGHLQLPGNLHMIRPSAVLRQDFPVAVMGQYISTSRYPWTKKKIHTILTLRDPDLAHRVDVFTWGVIATEIRPFTLQYAKTRANAVLVFLALSCLILMLLLRVVDMTVFVLVLLSYFAMLCYCGPYLEPIMPEKLIGQTKFQDLHRQITAKVQELAPLVAERSGIHLDYQTECDSCGNTSGYVWFRQDPPSSDANRPSATLLSV